MGPLLLGRLLDLNEVQAGVLNIVFQVADDEGLLLIDLKDLRAMLVFVADHASDIREEYGNVSSASVGAIQRGLLTLEQQGGDLFFGEPALELEDLMLSAPDGSGAVNILAADRLMQSPRLYATFLLWLLAELFENLPEVGDSDRPKLVFFFDEAHLLFDDAPKALVDKVEQVVRLIRSKGVGVYFVTQNPQDIPDDVLGQLGNRVQHALRAYTPRDQKAVRAAAETFRPNPALDTEAVITELGVGEALISFLEEDGVPAIVDRALVAPPLSRIGPASKGERAAILAESPLGGVYDEAVDRESAYEKLKGQAGAEAMEPGDSGAWRRPGGKERRSSRWRGEDAETMPTKSPAKSSTRRSTRAPKREKGMVEKVLMGDGRKPWPRARFAPLAARLGAVWCAVSWARCSKDDRKTLFSRSGRGQRQSTRQPATACRGGGAQYRPDSGGAAWPPAGQRAGVGNCQRHRSACRGFRRSVPRRRVATQRPGRNSQKQYCGLGGGCRTSQSASALEYRCAGRRLVQDD
jgi:hypothetical protein